MEKVSSPDPTLKEGNGYGKLWLNLHFSFNGAHRQGRIKLGSDTCRSLRLRLHVTATSGMIHVHVYTRTGGVAV